MTSTTGRQRQRNAEIAAMFAETRGRTLQLVRTLERDDFMVQTAFYTSPPKWHLGHVSWLHEVVLGRISAGYRPCHPEGSAEYLNSYYNQFGRPHDKGSRGAVSRPTLDQVLAYFDEVSRRVAGFLGENEVDGRCTTLLMTSINHECQHQELLVYDLQHILADRYRPAARSAPPPRPPAPADQPPMVDVRGGIYSMGHSGGGFCYDVELPEHRVYLDDFRIGRYPVTNGEYMGFVDGGGYGDFRYWLADGWEKVKENGWEAPMYWERAGGSWHTADFGGRRPVNPDEPVVHVSFYEADAFCRWAGKRLPTEAEWEKAACWSERRRAKAAFPWGDDPPSADRCNLLESHLWKASEIGSYPGGGSECGCQHMIGDVWEWTSSEFVGYPGFRTGFEEYNDKWFANQKVLRGGSFGTPSSSIRGSYRNFFRPDERWMFAGIRCAEGA